MDEKVSVIIPVYNVKAYLDRCIQSVLQQTYRNIEVILVDDGSTDGSQDLCDAYQDRDGRVIVYHQTNQGVSSARNIGLGLSTGLYIMFVDADDHVDPGIIEKMMEKMAPDIGMCVCGLQYMDENGVSVSGHLSEGPVVYSREEYALKLKAWGPVCRLIRRGSIKDIRFPSVAISEDLCFLAQILCEDEDLKIACVDEKLYFYRMRENSAMNQGFSLKYFDSVIAQERVLDLFTQNGIAVDRSDILKNAIEVFFYKYFGTSRSERKKYEEEYRKVRRIAWRNKRYILGGSDMERRTKFKRIVFVYMPCLYGIYIRAEYR